MPRTALWRVLCRSCNTHLYTYRKAGKGNLIKCYESRIAVNRTNAPCKCPGCGSLFCLVRKVRGKPAHKLLSDRVQIQRHDHDDDGNGGD